MRTARRLARGRRSAPRLGARRRIRSAPAVLALQVGPDGVEAWLSGPVDWAPRRWSLARDGHRWLLEAATDLDELARETEDTSPAACAGRRGRQQRRHVGTPLEPGSCTPVIGEGADDCVRSMVTSLGGWSWSEQVHVTEDPFEAERLCALFGWKDDQLERARVVFVATRDGCRRPRCRAAPSDHCPGCRRAVTVAVASGAATLEPSAWSWRPTCSRRARPSASTTWWRRAPR